MTYIYFALSHPGKRIGGSVTGQSRDGLVKIGVSRDPQMRAASLPGVLLAAVPGDEHDEARIHERFAHLRVGSTRSEWFEADRELLTLISYVRIGFPLPPH